MSEPEEIVAHKVRRAVGISVLRRIGRIIAEEQRAEEDKAHAVRGFMRYGWLAALVAVLVWAYWAGVI